MINSFILNVNGRMRTEINLNEYETSLKENQVGVNAWRLKYCILLALTLLLGDVGPNIS